MMIFSQDFRFSSFPRLRESSNLLKRMDTRFRGYDEQGGFRPLNKDKTYQETVSPTINASTNRRDPG